MWSQHRVEPSLTSSPNGGFFIYTPSPMTMRGINKDMRKPTLTRKAEETQRHAKYAMPKIGRPLP
jgi:hypothetical protein